MNYNAQKSGELQATRANGEHRSGIVLIVDDEVTLLVALERQFRLAGLYPVTATTIDGAWKVLDSWVVHVVVSDERMPDGSGANFLADVGKSFPGVGRLLLTAWLEPYLLDLAKERGFVALDKECKFSDLLDAVKRELGNDA